MTIGGKRIKCVSNFQAPELTVDKVYTAGEVRTNTHGVWQVEVEGRWYAQVLFELTKEEGMKQQFYVGDVVEVVKTEAENWYKIGDKFVVSGWNDGKDALSSEPPHVTIEGEEKGVWVLAKDLKILSRAWQKNTGEQPVEDYRIVEYRQRGLGWRSFAGDVLWTTTNTNPITEWRLADSVSSVESQPEGGVPPSHVAMGEELVAMSESEKKKKHSHYFKKCGYDYVDVYRVLKMFDVTDPCISHACKKLLVSGGRGFKDINHDIQDVIDTLVRWQEMQKEDNEDA